MQCFGCLQSAVFGGKDDGVARVEAQQRRRLTVCDEFFPMTCTSISVFMLADIVPSYLELFDKRLLVEVPDSQAVVHFISHQWLGYTHPDPDGVQLRRMQAVFRRFLEFDGSSLFSDADWQAFLSSTSQGTNARVAEFERRAANNLNKTNASVVDDIRRGQVWMDYISVPGITAKDVSPSNNRLVLEVDSADKIRAVNSIPAYVERADYFWILAPTAVHYDNGETCNFSTWRTRGWCRLEEWANCLARQRCMPLVITEAAKVATIGYIDFLFANLGHPEKAPCRGRFTCCVRNHLIDGKSIPCDSTQVAPILKLLAESKLKDLSAESNRLMYCMISCLTMTLYAGSAITAKVLDPNETIDAFLQRTAFKSLDDVNEVLDTPLHWAVVMADRAVVRKVVEACPRLLYENNIAGLGPLTMAIYRPDNQFDSIISDKLGFEKSDVFDSVSKSGISLLHRAAKGGFTDSVRKLITLRANIEMRRFDNGHTPLLSAAEAGHAEVCRLLVSESADIQACGLDSSSGLHLLASPLTLLGNESPEGKLQIAHMLLQHRTDPCKRDVWNRTPLDVASLSNWESMVALFRERMGANGKHVCIELPSDYQVWNETTSGIRTRCLHEFMRVPVKLSLRKVELIMALLIGALYLLLRLSHNV
eukprot:TRINITY_DN10716_c0_g2_i1.p1 TRINITY_DN10716_c0_g2~~TRINITY_DN10716_c0_g2_i1.p1  ORF type:complete len:649 (+),score=31.08 TRINITY_DN10716_c0_g2_i1:111-2057(+)